MIVILSPTFNDSPPFGYVTLTVLPVGRGVELVDGLGEMVEFEGAEEAEEEGEGLG